MSLYMWVKRTAFGQPPWFYWVGLWVFDLLLGVAIVLKIPYTEIDWVAYMEQIRTIRSGQTDYQYIKGGTGPLVYPGGHVVIFDLLYDLTDSGSNLRIAQWYFLGVYLVTLGVVLSIYRKARIPFIYAGLLLLSKRLHSIYVLRLFNDVFATLFAVIGVRLVQSRYWTASAIAFSLAISVKMSALLYLPGLAIVYWGEMGWLAALLGPPFIGVQVAVALRFKEHIASYFKGAFDFSRQFLYKWTVNWRFIDETTFLSQQFAQTLLAGHLTVLGALAAVGLGTKHTSRASARLIAISNLIGVLFARSLHYQFYSWFYWSIPFLLADLPLPFIGLWLALEYAWNTFPSTDLSSGVSFVSITIIVIGGLIAASREPRKVAQKA